MNRRLRIICFLALAALTGAAAFPAPGPAPTRPLVEVSHVPREDFSRAPGFSKTGVFLPLSELLELAKKAERPDRPAARQNPLYCQSLRLTGSLQGDALRLEGQLSFSAPGKGWSAARIDDGHMFWSAQDQAPGAAPAFAGRVNGSTYLFAEGPTTGTLSLKALVPVAFVDGEANLDFGTFFAPCRFEIAQEEGVRLVSATGPVERIDSGGQATTRQTVWAPPNSPLSIRLRREPALHAPSSLQVKVQRAVSVIGAGMQVCDDLTLRDQFSPGTPLRVPLPKGIRVLWLDASDELNAATEGEDLVLRPLRKAERVTVRVVGAAVLRDEEAALGAWSFPGAVQQGVLTLTGDVDYIPVPVDAPDTLVPVAARQPERRYEVWGPLPALRIAMARARPLLAPSVQGRLSVKRGEASADFVVKLADRQARELVFAVPPEWSLADLKALSQGIAFPCSIQQKDGAHWRVAWDAIPDPGLEIHIALHRVGAWGAPGTTEELALPLPQFEGPRPDPYELRLFWPDELEGRVGQLSAMSLVPAAGRVAQRNPKDAPRIAVRATGPEPRGALTVSGRNSDIQATVVSALSIGENRARVRALIDYQVRFAPAHTFRFTLSPGVGHDLRIDGEGIRESLLKTSETADEWTIVTQQDVLGPFQLTLEWPIEARLGQAPILSPQIRLTGVASQRGFIALEGSEAMRLTCETQNLAETEMAELPSVPWTWENRVLAVYRYVEPPFLLRLKSERLQPAPGLEGLVRQARLNTAISREGVRFTRAEYTVAPMADRQFFEIQLPPGVEVWSVMVNGEGVKPARRKAEDGTERLMAPTPAGAAGSTEFKVAVLYRELAAPLSSSTRLLLAGPMLPVPVNRTEWNLSLPPGYEYLAFGGSMLGQSVSTVAPLLSFFRSAHYPAKVVFLETPIGKIEFISVATVILVFLLFIRRKSPTARGDIHVDVPKTHAPRNVSGCLAWVLVLVVIVVLAMIAVPNFLEAQVRSKVSRVKADQRSLATAIEAYYVDNNSFPNRVELLWQGPVQYLAGEFKDAFSPDGSSGGGRGMHYVVGVDALQRAAKAGLVAPDDVSNAGSFWMTYSLGPDGRDDGGQIVFDPTNGTVSAGDVIRVPYESRPAEGRYAQVRGAEATRRDMAGPVNYNYDPSNGTTSPGDVYRVQQRSAAGEARSGTRQAAQATLTFADNARNIASDSGIRVAPPAAAPAPQSTLSDRASAVSRNGDEAWDRMGPASAPQGAALARREMDEIRKANAPIIAGVPDVVIGDKEHPAETELSREDNWFRYTDAFGIRKYITDVDDGRDKAFDRRGFVASKQDRGLLSLNIEIPEGGVQRSFETLGGEAKIEIRTLEADRFKRLRFLTWVVVALALSAVWLFRRQAYRPAFLATVAITLAAPVVAPSAGVVFLNAAFVGALVSLACPCGAFVWRRIVPRPGRGALSASILALALALHPSAQAQTPESRPTISKRIAPAAPIQIVVPYGEEEDPTGSRDWLAFIGDGDFTRLWNAAHPESRPGARRPAILADVRLEGALSAESSTVEGSISLLAVNPNDVPVRVAAGFPGFALDDSKASQPGASLAADEKGLVLLMDAHWAGRIDARFVSPCATQGATGSFSASFPETASGQWQLRLPYRNILASGAPCLRETLKDATVLSGPARPGPLEIRWSPDQTAPETTANAESRWRAEIRTTVVWHSLSTARWTSVIGLESLGGGQLPTEARFGLDPQARVSGAEGPTLRSATVSDSQIVLQLNPANRAEITLHGIWPGKDAAPDKTDATNLRTWTLAGLREPQGVEVKSTVRFEISDQIEVLAIEPERLERRPSREVKQGYAVQLYDASSPEWKARCEFRRMTAAFDANVAEVFIPQEGLLRRTAGITVTPRGSALPMLRIEAPAGVRIRSVEGAGLSGWVQSGREILVTFARPIEESVGLKITADSDLPPVPEALNLEPLSIRGASKVKRSVALVVPPESELEEAALGGATPIAPTDEHRSLAGMASSPAPQEAAGSLRAYSLASDTPLKFGLKRIEAASRDTVYNRVVIADGQRSLRSVFQAEPRRGRIERIQALLCLAEPDPDAPSRLQAVGPVRDVRTVAVSDRVWRVEAELDAPKASPVTVQFQLDQRAETEGDKPLGVTLLVPAQKSGSRAFLLLRRALEGELSPSDPAGAKPVEPGQVVWPDAAFHPLPSDLAFELPSALERTPKFAITRHKRDEALRAVVEFMRLRTIVTTDGFERNELEIVMQNQSEQFLKIAFPDPITQVSVYEVQVASRVVKPAYVKEQGRDALSVPLIRTGLFDPELTVRVAYTTHGRAPMEESGKREQKMPEILGGTPVAESVLTLMLPSSFDYTGFKGSLQPVAEATIGVEEAQREAKRLEKVSEAALLAEGHQQRLALETLQKRKGELMTKLKAAKGVSLAYENNLMQQAKSQAEPADLARFQQESAERAAGLKKAEESQALFASNFAQLDKVVVTEAPQAGIPQGPPPQQAAKPTVKPPAATPRPVAAIAFPRSGNVFVFRQLQGVGSVAFHYASRDRGERRNDLLFCLGVIAALAAAPLAGRYVFASRRRAACAALLVCLGLFVAEVAVDLAVPGMALALIFLAWGRRPKTKQ